MLFAFLACASANVRQQHCNVNRAPAEHYQNRSSTWFHDAPWLDFNGTQIGWKGSTLLQTLDADYARKPSKRSSTSSLVRAVDVEDAPVDDWEVRLQAYQSVLAGACGHTYGHHDIWPFDSPGLEYAKRWREA